MEKLFVYASNEKVMNCINEHHDQTNQGPDEPEPQAEEEEDQKSYSCHHHHINPLLAHCRARVSSQNEKGLTPLSTTLAQYGCVDSTHV
ncbi:jg18481 [Pararge aegeria aegeria]|uniref:Jg18481 protein n=1 Tax=Pararge aegeria aegeria TaxID=348720 RepID=A0A8S4RJM5_9NEOP|nr:jg18481 [Pararge aegeria aegeria]